MWAAAASIPSLMDLVSEKVIFKQQLMSSTNQNIPSLMDLVSEKVIFKQQLKDKPAQDQDGALHQSNGGGQVDGNYEGYVMKKSFYTRASLYPLVTAGAAITAGIATVALLANNR